MASRLELHEELCTILGTENAYFNPPESLKMKYPCIRYRLADINIKYSNNKKYKNMKQYEVIVIDQDPDSNIYEKILEHFTMSNFDRMYTAENLNHFVLTIYY